VCRAAKKTQVRTGLGNLPVHDHLALKPCFNTPRKKIRFIVSFISSQIDLIWVFFKNFWGQNHATSHTSIPAF